METIDDEITNEAIRFMMDAKKADKPFFLWWNSTRMHIWTRLKESARGRLASASTPTAWRNMTPTSAGYSTRSKSLASKAIPS